MAYLTEGKRAEKVQRFLAKHGYQVDADQILRAYSCSKALFWMSQKGTLVKRHLLDVIRCLERRQVMVIKQQVVAPPVEDPVFTPATQSEAPKVLMVKVVAKAVPEKQLFDEHRWQLEAHHTRNVFNVCQECGNIEYSREADTCSVCGATYPREHHLGTFVPEPDGVRHTAG